MFPSEAVWRIGRSFLFKFHFLRYWLELFNVLIGGTDSAAAVVKSCTISSIVNMMDKSKDFTDRSCISCIKTFTTLVSCVQFYMMCWCEEKISFYDLCEQIRKLFSSCGSMCRNKIFCYSIKLTQFAQTSACKIQGLLVKKTHCRCWWSPELELWCVFQFLFLSEVLQWRAQTTPDHVLYTLLSSRVTTHTSDHSYILT